MANSSIEWTNAVWNPVRGCSVVSPGCKNCYAMKQARRFSGPGGAYEGLTRLTSNGPVWTGEVRFVPEMLHYPLKLRKPHRIFVNSMSDLFHEQLSDECIQKIFKVMCEVKQHTFQVLTKRPKRMLEFLSHWDSMTRDWGPLYPNTWPQKHVWLGVSCENQATADERIPLLLQTPAAVRWVSAEPLLGPIDLTAIKRTRAEGFMRPLDGRFNKINWVVAGSESGPRARPAEIAWFRSLRDQCASGGVPFFLKQFADHGKKIPTPELDGVRWMQYPQPN
jgi:protein gp37